MTPKGKFRTFEWAKRHDDRAANLEKDSWLAASFVGLVAVAEAGGVMVEKLPITQGVFDIIFATAGVSTTFLFATESIASYRRNQTRPWLKHYSYDKRSPYVDLDILVTPEQAYIDYLEPTFGMTITNVEP